MWLWFLLKLYWLHTARSEPLFFAAASERSHCCHRITWLRRGGDHTVNGCLWLATMAAMQPIIVQLPRMRAHVVWIFTSKSPISPILKQTAWIRHAVTWAGLSPTWRGLDCRKCAANETVSTARHHRHHHRHHHHYHHYVGLANSCCTVSVMQQGHDALLWLTSRAHTHRAGTRTA